jgi:predicted Zn-dependent protease
MATPIASEGMGAPSASATPEAPSGSFDLPLGWSLSLVGFEDYPQPVLERLQAHFHDKYGIVMTILPPIEIDEAAYDARRGQLIADRLLDTMEERAPTNGVRNVVIALTEYDIMMLDRPDYAFVFSLRDIPAGLAVVSTARMDPRAFGERRDPDLLFERASKLVAKNIGVMYLELPGSEDPRSVMYNEIFSLRALDTVREDLFAE